MEDQISPRSSNGRPIQWKTKFENRLDQQEIIGIYFKTCQLHTIEHKVAGIVPYIEILIGVYKSLAVYEYECRSATKTSRVTRGQRHCTTYTYGALGYFWPYLNHTHSPVTNRRWAKLYPVQMKYLYLALLTALSTILRYELSADRSSTTLLNGTYKTSRTKALKYLTAQEQSIIKHLPGLPLLTDTDPLNCSGDRAKLLLKHHLSN